MCTISNIHSKIVYLFVQNISKPKTSSPFTLEVPEHECIFASSPTCTDTQYKAAQDKISGPVGGHLSEDRQMIIRDISE